MEYVVLTATCPTFLNTQLPAAVQGLLGFQPRSGALHSETSRSLTFFARRPGIARVVTTLQAQYVLASEYTQNRYLGKASVSSRGLFNIPAAVQRALGLQTVSHGDAAPRSTEDLIMWFLPAPEYFEYSGAVHKGRAWSGPSSSRFTHVYLAKSILPLDARLEELTRLEARVEESEWTPRVEALQRLDRTRRAT